MEAVLVSNFNQVLKINKLIKIKMGQQKFTSSHQQKMQIKLFEKSESNISLAYCDSRGHTESDRTK